MAALSRPARPIFRISGHDVTADLATLLDEDRAVADLAADPATGMNHELLARRQFALESPMDLGHVDPYLALEGAALGDSQHTTVHRRVNTPFDHQRVAVEDLRAAQLDLGTDDQATVALARLVAPAGRRITRGRSRRRHARSGLRHSARRTARSARTARTVRGVLAGFGKQIGFVEHGLLLRSVTKQPV